MKGLQRSIAVLALSLTLAGGWAQASESGRIDIQRVLPNGQLTREIPAGEPVTLRISGVWHDGCTPAVAGFERSGQGRLLNLFWNRALLIGCAQVLTPFSRDLDNVRFDEGEIGVLPVTVLNTHGAAPSGNDALYLIQGATVLPSVELAIQAPASRQVAHWPTARRPPDGLYALTPIHDISGGWYAPEHAGSGLMIDHQRRQAGSTTQDEFWGTWTNFAVDGESQWHLFSETYWVTPTRALGKVFRAMDEPRGCTREFPNPTCIFEARAAKRLDPVGIFQLDLQGPDELVLTIDDSGTTLLLGLMQPPVEGYRVRLRRL